MNRNRLFNILGCGLVILLTACQAAKAPLDASLVQPVDATNSFQLATGAADAPPLWAFCSAGEESIPVRTFQCRAPVGQTLAVGYRYLLADSALLNGSAADLNWEVSIDDTLVDLASFGTYDYVMPGMPASPSPVREAFVRMTDWNLAMTHTNPGEHILFFRARDSAGYYYEWLVHLTIEGEDGTDIGSVPFPPHS